MKRIDPVKEYIIMKDDTIIRFHYIKELQGEIFKISGRSYPSEADSKEIEEKDSLRDKIPVYHK